MTTVQCPECRKVFEEEPHVVGRWGVRCPNCKRVFENSRVKPALQRAGLWHPGHDPAQERCDTLADAMYGIAGVEHKPSSGGRKPLSLEEHQRREAAEDELTASWAG